MARLLVIIAVFLVALAWIFSRWTPDGLVDPQPAAAVQLPQSVQVDDQAAPQPPVIAGNGVARIVIPRSADGHFYVDAQVGAASIHFVVDTGATAVALSKSDAQRAGLGTSAGDYTGTAMTANGPVRVRPVMIDHIRVGPIDVTNVEGAVIDGEIGVSLLGQSWLRRVGTVTIKGDQLILS